VAEGRRDWASMDRGEAVERIMRELGVARQQAEFILALELGETEGDAVLDVEE
jgi:hypothetical protein